MFRITLIILLGLPVSSWAQTAPATEIGKVDVSEWEVSIASGYGFLENPIVGKPDGETYFLPSFSYYGERFFVSNLTLGYSLLEEKNFYLDLIARPNEDGLYYNLDNDTAATAAVSNFAVKLEEPGVAETERKNSVLGGPSFTLVTRFVDVSFSWLEDISDVHHGSETHLSFDKQFSLAGGAFGFGIGAIKKDMELVRYYYQFTPAEAGIYHRRYAVLFPADDAIDQYARIHFSYPLSKYLDLRLTARYNQFDLAGRNPLFIENRETLDWFAGLQYRIGSNR
ncbi:MipA/OmpV family protein [Microbulbifer pacificus]|uniref:MipA/OmpV family protein n=1 Tax=Microbulbifer pacificus TaxID=407164 RepID=A0AAU0MUM4_9GAMM|nr:MipA/OmpV family protein [Microbulbifer pacificus]WOX04162.1 MipA/OmpV family protein [Microbulbifer pacificus]